VPDIFGVVLSAFVPHVCKNGLYFMVFFILSISVLLGIIALIVLVKHGHIFSIFAIVWNATTSAVHSHISFLAGITIRTGAMAGTPFLSRTVAIIRVGIRYRMTRWREGCHYR